MAELQIGFAKFNPGSGNGDQAVSVSAEKHTGRGLRTVGAKIAVESGTPSHDFTVNQEATPEFVEIQETAAIAKEGGSVTLKGKTNSKKLTFALSFADPEHKITIALPESYTAAGANTVNGAEIAADPGYTAEFQYSITFANIPENATVFDQTAVVTVTDEAGNQDSCTITQAEGDPRLTIDTDTINLNVNGDPQTLNVVSNTNWSITAAVSRAMKAMMAR